MRLQLLNPRSGSSIQATSMMCASRTDVRDGNSLHPTLRVVSAAPGCMKRGSASGL